VGTAEFAGLLDLYAARAAIFRGVPRREASGWMQRSVEPRFVPISPAWLSATWNWTWSARPTCSRYRATGPQVPQLRIVIDHSGRRGGSTRAASFDWLRGLAAVARYGTVHCKVSGLSKGAAGPEARRRAKCVSTAPFCTESEIVFGQSG
jgi:hypothetical protein